MSETGGPTVRGSNAYVKPNELQLANDEGYTNGTPEMYENDALNGIGMCNREIGSMDGQGMMDFALGLDCDIGQSWREFFLPSSGSAAL